MATSSSSSVSYFALLPLVVLVLLSSSSSSSCFISATAFLFSDHKHNTKPAGFTARLIHRDSPESPFYDPNLTNTDGMRYAMQPSLERYTMRPNDLRAPVTYRIPISEYVMSFRVGTPPVNTYAIIDTGSAITWLQCRPCDTCYTQEYGVPIFNPTNSTSYEKLGCEDVRCKPEYGVNCGRYRASCLYQVEYGVREAVSQGIMSTEIFHFLDDSVTGEIATFELAFGCAHKNDFPSYRKEGKFGPPGVVGLNREALSFISQLSFERFSHCFVPMSWRNQTSLLRFGSDAIITSETTPMLDYPHLFNGLYYVGLRGISVGNTKLNILKEAFGVTIDGDGGVIIDSGSSTTNLVGAAYDPLVTELKKQIKLEIVVLYDGGPLCYDHEGVPDWLNLMPEIVFHFDGLNFVLQRWNAWMDIGPDVSCLKLFRSPDYLTIIAAYQLQNVNVGYDLRNKVISLQNRDCTKN